MPRHVTQSAEGVAGVEGCPGPSPVNSGRRQGPSTRGPITPVLPPSRDPVRSANRRHQTSAPLDEIRGANVALLEPRQQGSESWSDVER